MFTYRCFSHGNVGDLVVDLDGRMDDLPASAGPRCRPVGWPPGVEPRLYSAVACRQYSFAIATRVDIYEDSRVAEPAWSIAEAVGWARFRRVQGWPSPPVRLGRYELRRTLGHGGMGHVFEAWDPDLARCVALKVLDQADADAITAARHEARCLARLSHPNVVRVHEVGEAELAGIDPPNPGLRAYVAMELVDGVGLRTLSGSWRRRLDGLLAAGRGLAAIHEAGLVHGDFKTGNVLVGRDGVVRVIDLGLASELGSASEVGPMFEVRAGTVAFMAPERLEGEGSADSLGDQWSFCVTAWELLFGVLPFGAGSAPESILAAIALGRLDHGCPLRGLPSGVAQVLQRGLAEDRADRYRSMTDLLAALEAAAERPGRRRRRAWRGSLALTLTVSLAGLAGLGHERERCVAEVERLDLQWDPVARVRLHLRFMASDQPAPRADFDWVSARLDTWTSRWRDAWAGACDQPCTAEADCLRRQRDEFAALLELLLTPSDELARASRSLVAQLDEPGVCESGLDSFEVPELGLVESAATERRLALALEAGALTRASDELAALDRSLEQAPIGAVHDRSILIADRWRARLWIELGSPDALAMAGELLRDALVRAELAGPALEDVRMGLLFERLRLHARSEAPSLEAIRDDGQAALSLVERSGSAASNLAWGQAYGQALARVDVDSALALLEPALARLASLAPAPSNSPTMIRRRLALSISIAELHDRAGRHDRAAQGWQSALVLAEALHGEHAIELIPVLRGLARNAATRPDPRASREALDRLSQLLRDGLGDPAGSRALAREFGVPTH